MPNPAVAAEIRRSKNYCIEKQVWLPVMSKRRYLVVHCISPVIVYHLSLYTTCHCVPPVIVYHLSLYATCHCVPPVIVYHLSLYTACHCVPPVIVYHLSLYATCHCVLPVIVYHLSLCTACHCIPPVIVYHLSFTLCHQLHHCRQCNMAVYTTHFDTVSACRDLYVQQCQAWAYRDLCRNDSS